MENIRYEQSPELKKKINESRNILIITHVNSDGDAIGSTLAMAGILKKIGKKADMVTPNDFPEFLQWMEGAQDIIIFFRNRKKVANLVSKADLIICLDFSDSSRMEQAEDLILNSTAYKILIDHHPEPGNFTDLIISDTHLGSSAELLYHLIKDMGYGNFIDKTIGEDLYAGVMTDTGNFSFASSYPDVWLMIADLVKIGINKDRVYSKVYDNYSEKRMRLMGYSLCEKMKIFKKYRTAIISLSRSEMDRFEHEPGDTEGFVNLPFSIRGIRLTALFLEKKDHVRISLRSRGEFSVNDLSRKYLNGGGHRNAAGGELKMPLKDAVENFISILENYEHELK